MIFRNKNRRCVHFDEYVIELQTQVTRQLTGRDLEFGILVQNNGDIILQVLDAIDNIHEATEFILSIETNRRQGYNILTIAINGGETFFRSGWES